MQQTLSVIDLNAVKSNALTIKKLTGNALFYAVVKADAYGHGAERVCQALQPVTDGFCVAVMREGAALRIAGITKPILVFTPVLDGEDAALASYYNLTVTVADARSAYYSKGLDCHIKINTGMNRYGCPPCAAQSLLKKVKGRVVGIYSHLYAPQSTQTSKKQLSLFNSAESALKAAYPDALSHIAASGGILSGKEYFKDMVRCGIMLYGYTPEGFTLKGLRPALKVYARRVQYTKFIGGGIGYSSAEKDYGLLSAYRLGYADGFLRGAPLGEGKLCMDAFIAEDGKKWRLVMSDAKEYAARCNTIPYEVLCSVTRRSRRVYIN